jgi:hypothetical protein
MKFFIFFLLLSVSDYAFSDTPESISSLFSGKNIYAPSVLSDGQYKMWYGGWQTQADYPNDLIYYRSSANNETWSSPVVVLRPIDIGTNVVHVNDPSVTKHFNQSNGKWQYTMFYTVCVSPCNQQDNQVWSSTSPDGTHWGNHKVLLAGGFGSAEPSAILQTGINGAFWRVYYVDRTDASRVKFVNVNGNREAISTAIAYTHPGTISGVEVRYINNQWQMFFNVFYTDRVDIFKTISSTNDTWVNFEPLIVNTGATFCGTLTPAILDAGPGKYFLYFGLTKREINGSCDLTKQTSIEKWKWVD